MGTVIASESELRLTVKEFLEATGFSDEMVQYFVQRGLPLYEERVKGQFRPIRYVTIPDLARFIVNNYRLDLLPRIGVPLGEYLAKGTWRPPPVPERWSVSEVAHFLRVPESVVQAWNDIGALEGTEEEGLLWFDTETLADFLGLTTEEIAFSLPQTLTLKEVREMAIPTNLQLPAGDADSGPDIHQVPSVIVLTRNIGEFVPYRGTLLRFSRLYILDVLLNQGLQKWLDGLRAIRSLRQFVVDQVVNGGKVRIRERFSPDGASGAVSSAPLFEGVTASGSDPSLMSRNGQGLPTPASADGTNRVLVPVGLVPATESSPTLNPNDRRERPMDPRNKTTKPNDTALDPGNNDTVATIETTIRQAIKEAADGQLSRVGARLFAILELLERSRDIIKGVPEAPESPAAEKTDKEVRMEKPAVQLPSPATPAVKNAKPPARALEEEVSPTEVSSLKGLLWERRGDFVVRILTDLKGRKYEQRCTVDEFRAILLELKKYAAPHNKLFSTGQIIRALGWNKSNRFKVHLVAFVLAGKDQIRVLGHGKGSRFQITATENDLERTLLEVLTPPED